MISSQKLSLLAALICILLYGTSLYFEYNMNLMPCALCVIQRSFVILLGACFILSALHNCQHRRGWQVYSAITCFWSIGGILTSARHIWLQHHPALAANTNCLPAIKYMLQHFSLSKTFHLILSNSGGCADITWHFLGLTMPEWLLIFFIGFFLVSLFILLRPSDTP